jgi:hypothetical protein
MIRYVLAAAVIAAVSLSTPIAFMSGPAMAAAAKAEEKKPKPLTAQQQKMKDCGAKWQVEKKTKKVSGAPAYRKFLSTCLKG